jgi:hypothetical protein
MKRIPKRLRCSIEFLHTWKYRTVPGYGILHNIWRCRDCKQWSAYKDSFNEVCKTKERRKGKDRRK